MGTREVGKGPTATRAAGNLRSLREARGLSLAALSQRMGEVGRPMLPSGISKLEIGQRRMDVDDLMALSVALGVNPSRLLLPVDGDGDEPVELTETVSCPGWRAWQWVDGFAPYDDDPGDLDGDRFEDFMQHSRPPALRRLELHPAARAAKHLRDTVLRLLRLRTDLPDKVYRGTRIRVDQNIERLRQELDHLTDQQGRESDGQRR